MSDVPERIRQQARLRAQGYCEYCLIHEDDTFLSHEVDHIIAGKHGGQTVLENLAWSCAICNGFKGSDIATLDPQTGKLARLFHPRMQQWKRHFRLIGARITPLTINGRATKRILRLNDANRIDERLMLIRLGRYPWG